MTIGLNLSFRTSAFKLELTLALKGEQETGLTIRWRRNIQYKNYGITVTNTLQYYAHLSSITVNNK